MSSFRERLEDLLIENNISKYQLSKEVGVSPETICGYFRKDLYPEISIAKRIAELFNCSLDYLFGLTEQLTNNERSELSFIETLKKLLKENNLSVERAMKNLNLSESTFYRWQRGDAKPLTSMIISLAKYFDVSVDYLASEYVEK